MWVNMDKAGHAGENYLKTNLHWELIFWVWGSFTGHLFLETALPLALAICFALSLLHWRKYKMAEIFQNVSFSLDSINWKLDGFYAHKNYLIRNLFFLRCRRQSCSGFFIWNILFLDQIVLWAKDLTQIGFEPLCHMFPLAPSQWWSLSTA